MKTRWIKKFKKQASEVKMTAHEKRIMLSRIFVTTGGIPSPYSFVLAIAEHRKGVLAAVIAAAFILTSGGTSYAATAALPGEALYTIKVNVNEEIQNLVATTPDAKAKVSIEHTKKRLVEAEELSKKGKLTDKTQAIIETGIQKHADSVKANAVTLASENATATAKTVLSDLKASITEHETTLNAIASSTPSEGDDKQINSIISKVNQVKMEIDTLEVEVSGTSTQNATSSATSTIPSTNINASSTKSVGTTTATTTTSSSTPSVNAATTTTTTITASSTSKLPGPTTTTESISTITTDTKSKKDM